LAGAIVRQALLPYTIRDGAGKLLSHGQVEEIVLWSPLTRSYHFLFRVMNFWDSPMAITRVVRGGFGAFATDADWRRDYPLNRLLNFAPAPHPTTAVRPWPQNVAFDFRTFPVAPQWSSRYVFVATNARASGPGGTFQLFAGNGAGSTTIPVFRPL
jgi:hypothetical protein